MKTLRLTFPGSADVRGGIAALRAVIGAVSYGRTARGPICLETWAAEGTITHLLSAPTTPGVVSTLSTALPGVRIEEVERPTELLRGHSAAMSIRGPALGVIRTDIPADLATGLLAALATVGRREALVIQWLAVPMRRGFMSRRAPEDRLEKAKRSETEVLAAGRIAAWSGDRRRVRALVASVTRVLRSASGADGYLRLRFSPWGARRLVAMRPPFLVWPSHLNVAELAGLVGWPISPTPIPGLERGASRLLPPPNDLPTNGPKVGVTTFPGTERSIQLGDRLQTDLP